MIAFVKRLRHDAYGGTAMASLISVVCVGWATATGSMVTNVFTTIASILSMA
jgi:Flp pilus assembly pilin Flp